ncbi:hypothetical protein NMY22_g10073 [Coprinellus aureogranulatus]|nr:hypothetical protein NMY22_g10073 [Coprinellus aureogranulatus]
MSQSPTRSGTPNAPGSGASTPAAGTSGHKHALTAVEKQRSQLERLLKDPAKPVYIPPPPKEKTIRAPREMMKNVQGSSAGAGSGEFHVYKAARRREYERLRILEEEAEKEQVNAEFERKRKEAEEAAEAKTAKNRAKRQKKKAKAKGGPSNSKSESNDASNPNPAASESSAPLKKRRLVNGQELVFKKPGEESEDDDEEVGPQLPTTEQKDEEAGASLAAPVVENRITIIEDE